MASTIKLTPTQLAGLDFLIARSEEFGFIDDVAHVANAVVQVAGAVAVVAAVVAGPAEEFYKAAPGGALPDLKKLSIKQLKELREKAHS